MKSGHDEGSIALSAGDAAQGRDEYTQRGPASAHGVIQSAVDINVQFGFGSTFPDDHSAQWTWPIQTTMPYYLQILKSINP